MPYFPDKIKHAIGDDSMIYIDLIDLFCVFEMESTVSGISIPINFVLFNI